METTVLLVIFSMMCFTFLILGGIIGWLAQQNNYINLQNQGIVILKCMMKMGILFPMK